MKLLKLVGLAWLGLLVYLLVAHLVLDYIRTHVGEFNAFGLINELDEDRDTCQLVKAKGFRCETHTITSSDGYIIDIHRIRPLLAGKCRKPVILQCGLTGTSSNWIITSARVNMLTTGDMLGFELAKQGYDVWLSNNRGNKYAKRHLRYDPLEDERFWNFTFDEMSERDLPALIQMVQAKTNSSQVAYVGHSQGTMIMFALLSRTSKWNSIISPYIAISPVLRFGKATTGCVYVYAYVHRFHAKLSRPIFANALGHTIRRLLAKTWPFRYLMVKLNHLMCGTSDQVNQTRMATITAHSLSSTSFRNFAHFDQLKTSNNFSSFDYGPEENQRRYGQERPPPYELSNITHAHTHVIYSRNDLFVPLEAIEQIKNELPASARYFEASDPTANHIDVLMGMETAREVNHHVLQILSQYHTK